MIIKNNLPNIKLSDNIYIFIILLLTVSPFFMGFRVGRVLIITMLFALIIYRKKSWIINKKLIILFFLYLLITLIQGYYWEFSIISFFSSFIFTFFTAHLLFALYGLNLLNILEKVIRFWTWLAMFFFVVGILLPEIEKVYRLAIIYLDYYSFDADRYQTARSMIFYTIERNLQTPFFFNRNSGFAHEPGGFAVFLIFAIIINIWNGYKIYDKRNYIYILALFTTTSTTGYLSFIILFFITISQTKIKILSTALIILFLLVFYNYFNEYDFLGQKINYVYETGSTTPLNQHTAGRYHAMLKTMNVIQKYPLFGRGVLGDSEPGSYYDAEKVSGGWHGTIARFGLPLGILIIFLFIQGINYFSRRGGISRFGFIIITVSILMNLASQSYLFNPFFLYLFIIGLYYNDIKKLSNK